MCSSKSHWLSLPVHILELTLSNRGTTRAFGPLMARAATLSIVEADKIVEVGEIDPDDVIVPGIYVDRVCPAVEPRAVELLTIRDDEKAAKEPMSPAKERRDRIAKRAALELKDGYYANLGVGMPTLVANNLPPGVNVTMHTENGALGVGPYPTKDQVNPDLSKHTPSRACLNDKLI